MTTSVTVCSLKRCMNLSRAFMNTAVVQLMLLSRSSSGIGHDVCVARLCAKVKDNGFPNEAGLNSGS